MDNVEKIIPGEAKKLGKKVKIMRKLDDDQLEVVSGGYWERKGGYANGYWIECPNCGNTIEGRIATAILSHDLEMDGFICLKCGYQFGVDADGDYYAL